MPTSSTRLAYLPLFVRDFITDPVVLTMRWLDQAIYLRMLMASWEAGPLPDNPNLIGRLIDAPRLVGELEAFGADGFSVHEAIESVLEACWERTEEDDGWASPRLERERAHGLELVASRSDHGRRGAKARWGNARAMPEHSSSNGKPMPSQAQAQAQEKNQKKKTPQPPKGGVRRAVERPEEVPIPDTLAGVGLEDWIAHRRALRKPPTAIALRRLIAKLTAWGPARARAAIAHSLEHNWEGVFEPDERRNGREHVNDAPERSRQQTLKELGLA